MKKWMIVLLVLGLFFAASATYAQSQEVNAPQTVTLTADLPSGQLVGTVVTWTVTDDIADPVDYCFRFGRLGEAMQLMVDYSDKNVFPWAPLEDGVYVVEASVRNLATGEVTVVTQTFDLLPRATSTPVVTAIDHPLIALYSAPACVVGGEMRVFFKPLGGAAVMATNAKPCTGTHSMNFYVAGMKANTNYVIMHEITSPNQDTVYGPWRFFQTGSLPYAFPNHQIKNPPDAQTSLVEGVLLVGPGPSFGQAPVPRLQYATNLVGDVIWYDSTDYELQPNLTRLLPGGNRLYDVYGERRGFVLRESDLAGRIVHETTVRRVSEQLVALGYFPATSFHHDAIRLPNGDTAVLGSTERILVDMQGEGPVDVLGDYVLVLDPQWQLKWVWDPFEKMDTARMAVLGERCLNEAPGCPPVLLAPIANDWMHTNAISYSAVDGNLLLSVRHQDWLVKIDYADGGGSGDIIWRMGAEGDFVPVADDPSPWFSHQHDADLIGAAQNQIVLYDNGNTRCHEAQSPCNSRGQVWSFDENGMTATLETNADLGRYSMALGSAQVLLNGNYHFGSGIVLRPQLPLFFSFADEALPDGSIDYTLQGEYSAYRSYRLRNLYTPPGQGEGNN